MTDSRIARCRQALQHNGFEVEYLSNTRKAGEYLRTLIEQSHPHSVSFGDSMTLYATGIIAWLRSQTDIPFIDTFEPGVRFKDLIERRREALTCELFLTGVNAVGEDGTLHWLDMIGNRIAPIAFGPAIKLYETQQKLIPGFGRLLPRKTWPGMKDSKLPVP